MLQKRKTSEFNCALAEFDTRTKGTRTYKYPGVGHRH